jgi:hypothetical protein
MSFYIFQLVKPLFYQTLQLAHQPSVISYQPSANHYFYQTEPLRIHITSIIV